MQPRDEFLAAGEGQDRHLGHDPVYAPRNALAIIPPMNDVTRVLVVDDDLEIGQLLGGYLAKFGMTVEVATTGAQLRRMLRPGTFDVLLLDLMLPDDDGLALCRWAKGMLPSLPVIMLTAQGDPASRIVGLEIGADDYIPKPFEPRELVARIKAVLRRGTLLPADGEGLARFHNWSFDRMRRQLVSADGTVVALSMIEGRLLSAFLDHPGRVLSRDRLLDLSHAPGVEVNDRSVDLAISRLRAKLGDNGKEPSLIRTIRGEGYLFDAKVMQ